MHIGLIGGIGPAATIHYYQGLVDAHAAAGQALELTIVQGQARDLVANLSQGAAERQAEIFSALVARLQAGGAEAAAVTSMGGHFCIRELAAISPLPLIDLVPEMAAEFARRKLGRVGLMGTRNVMESHVYGAAGSTEAVLPEGDDLGATHDAYIAMAQAGRVTDEQRRYFFNVADRLVRDQGAEAVVLAGTDLFLAFQGHDPGYPVIDSAQVHIDAIHRAAVQGLGGG
ncbi:MAG: aspartate/glutamate racemase family protein [Alphaproteobacteria bacterium]|jgi:aspartate racemase|nr:aspartate/glutamate racemase family protein [Alphaproteobacteria bacterium]